MTPAPGWYQDGRGAVRWWTGRDWSGYTARAVPIRRRQGPSAAKIVLLTVAWIGFFPFMGMYYLLRYPRGCCR